MSVSIADGGRQRAAMMLATIGLATAGPCLAQSNEQSSRQSNEQSRAPHEPGPAEKLVTAPLRDTNIIKPKVPPILEQVMRHPYSTAGLKTCRQIAAAVRQLNGALGPDLDAPVAPGKDDQRAELAAAAAGAVVGSILPGEGLIRHITGADKAQKHAAAAVMAGSVRRGFLKGLGAGRGCKFPARPARLR